MATQAAMRAAAVELLTDYAASASVKLQVYAGRPRSLYPPTAFVDKLREVLAYVGPTLRQRTPTADVIVVHGLFDAKDAAEQKDAFVDGFLDWVNVNMHAAGPNTLIAGVATEDLPNYIPEWLPPEMQRQYYATAIALEGYSEG